MSDQRRLKWRSGGLTSTPIQDFWQIALDEQDPEVPNLPLISAESGSTIVESGAAAAASCTCASVAVAVFAADSDGSGVASTGVAASLTHGVSAESSGASSCAADAENAAGSTIESDASSSSVSVTDGVAAGVCSGIAASSVSSSALGDGAVVPLPYQAKLVFLGWPPSFGRLVMMDRKQ